MADTMELTENSHSNVAVPIKRTRTEMATTESESQSQLRRRKEANKAYGRGGKIPIHSIKDKKLRGNLKKLEARNKTAILRAKDAEILLENEDGFLEPENELERTYKVRQDEIKQTVPLETAKKGFELKLDQLGPYVCDYTRNGKDLILAGRKGHVATMDWREGKLGCELQLGETVRDAKWLHNNQLFAVAQKKYVYIYDGAGVELHCLKKHIEVTNMEFLPYHYLLATVVCKKNTPFNCVYLIFLGKCWTFKISRYLNRSIGNGNAHKIGIAYLSHSKPSKCNPSYGSPKRNSHFMVT